MTEVRNLLAAFPACGAGRWGHLLDVYRENTANRLCREGPVPVVRVRERTDCAGGAANTAVNLRRLGAEVDLVSLWVTTPWPRRCGLSSNRSAVGPASPSRPSGPPSPCSGIVVGGQLVARFDEETTAAPRPVAEAPLLARLGMAVKFLPFMQDRSTSGIIERIVESDRASSLPAPAEINRRVESKQQRRVVAPVGRGGGNLQIPRPGRDEAGTSEAVHDPETTSSPQCSRGRSGQNEKPPARRNFSAPNSTQPPTQATL